MIKAIPKFLIKTLEDAQRPTEYWRYRLLLSLVEEYDPNTTIYYEDLEIEQMSLCWDYPPGRICDEGFLFSPGLIEKMGIAEETNEMYDS